MTPQAQIKDSFPAPSMKFELVFRDKHGNVKHRDVIENLVLNGGKTDIIDKYLKGSSYTAAWYMLLKGSGTIAASDTLASHAGWTEVTAYSGNRPAITWGTTTSGSNTGTPVVFTFTGSYTVAGAGCATVATGSSGVLYDMADIATPRSGDTGDTLTITPTLGTT